MSPWCPPLFDQSPRAATKRLFLYASDGISHLLRSKFKVLGYVTEDYDYMAHMAWLIGGSSAAQALVREVGSVTESWGNGDDERALSLTKVGTMHMISVWFRSIEPGADAREDARAAAASSICSVINRFLWTGSEVSIQNNRDLDGFLNMDLQWNWENGTGAQPSTYAALLLARALDACGRPSVDWNKVVFPVGSVQQLLDAGAMLDTQVLEDSQVMPSVLACAEEGVRAVRRYHHMNIEGKIQPPNK